MRSAFRLLLPVLLPALMSAQAFSRSELLEALKSAPRAEELAAEVDRRGVSFFASPEDQAALKAAGAPPALLAAVERSFRPPGPPIAQADLVLLLRLGAPRQRLERLIEARGVAFAISPQAGAEILAAGGDSALVGLVALHQKTPSPPPQSTTPAPPAPPPPANRIPFQRIPPYDPDLPSGLCDLRVRVDQTTEFLLRGPAVGFEVKQGADPLDAGSSCTQPLPAAAVALGASKLRGRGKVTVLEQPAPGNSYTARILVEDPAGGNDLYHIRVSWTR